MRDVVIVDAVRTPVGRRNGGLSTCHSVDVLGAVQKALFDRTGVDPLEVGQVVGGCVGQVGMQSMNVTRTAWLTAGLPLEVPATTVDAQCGSSQQATNMAYSLVAGGVVDAAIGCGVEVMSQVGFGATTPREPNSGRPINRNYFEHFEFTSQFEGSERIARRLPIVGGLLTVGLAGNDIANGDSPGQVISSEVLATGAGIAAGAIAVTAGAPVLAVAAVGTVAAVGVGMLAEYAWDHWVPEDVTEAIDEGLRDFGEGVKDTASDVWDAVTPW